MKSKFVPGIFRVLKDNSSNSLINQDKNNIFYKNNLPIINISSLLALALLITENKPKKMIP